MIRGSGLALDTGRLSLEGVAKSSRLILQVDPAWREGPPGTDPLDIRDIFDWLEPVVELNPGKVETEILNRGPRSIPAWQNWHVTAGDAPVARLVTWWDEQTRPGQGYRLFVSAEKGPLRLTCKLVPRPYKDRLLLYVSRPRETSPSKLEVRVEGKSIGQFEIPTRYDAEVSPIAISLAEHHGQSVAIELIQQSQNERALVEWRAISLVGRTAVQ